MWVDFTKRYRKTIKRVLKIRNEFKIKFEFKPSEAFDFYLKEKSKEKSKRKKLYFMKMEIKSIF